MAGSDYYDTLYEQVYLAGKKLGISQALSDDMARMVDDGMRKEHGGCRIYMPAKSVEREQRDDDIIKDYLNDVSVKELMDKYDVSRATVYRVVGKG